MKIEIFTWDGSYATKKNKVKEINEFMKDKNIHSELDYWQDVLYRAENEIEYWKGEKEIALEMIEKLQGRYNK